MAQLVQLLAYCSDRQTKGSTGFAFPQQFLLIELAGMEVRLDTPGKLSR